MKPWLIPFVLLLACGLVWGLARDLLSKERGRLDGVVTAVDPGNPLPKWLPATPPRFKVRLADGQIVDVATKDPASVAVGGKIAVTEWVTPWGQVWYTQRQ